MENPFSWDYLTASPGEMETFGPFSIVYLVLFAFIFLASLYAQFDAPRRFKRNRVMRDAVIKGASILAWVTGVGLVFFGIRALQFEFIGLHMRLWLYLMFLILIGVIGYFIYYARTALPPRLAAQERERQRRQYVPGPGGRRARAPRPQAQPVRRRRAAR